MANDEAPGEESVSASDAVTITANNAAANDDAPDDKAATAADTVTINANTATTGDDITLVEAVQAISVGLEVIIDENDGTPLAAKLEDANTQVQTALDHLIPPPDIQAALGSLEGAVGDIEAAANEVLTPEQDAELEDLMGQVSDIARLIADVAIVMAIDEGGDSGEIADAEQFVAEGIILQDAEQFKDAVAKYKDATSKALSALP